MRRRTATTTVTAWTVAILLFSSWGQCFVPRSSPQLHKKSEKGRPRLLPSLQFTRISPFPFRNRHWILFASNSAFEDEEEEEEEDDDHIDLEALGDWRAFRKSLTEDSLKTAVTSSEENESFKKTTKRRRSVSRENEELLQQQNEELAAEYLEGVWAHETATVRACLFCYVFLSQPLCVWWIRAASQAEFSLCCVFLNVHL